MRLTVSDRPWRKGGAVRSADFTVRSVRGRSRPPQTVRADFVEVPDYIRLVKRIRAVVEIVPGPDGDPPEHLLSDAYSASRSGTIVLALNGVTAAATNRVMDGIVPHFPLSIPGVLYVDARNRPLLRWILDNTDMIFGETDEFRKMVPRFTAIFSTGLVMASCFRSSGVGIG